MRTYDYKIGIVSPDWENFPKYCYPHLWVYPNGDKHDINPLGFCELINGGGNNSAFYWYVRIPDSDYPVKSLDNNVCEAAILQWVHRTHGIGAPNINGAPNYTDRVRNITRMPASLNTSYTLSLEVWTDPADPTYDSVYRLPHYNGFNYQYQLRYSFDINRVEGQLEL